MGYLVLGLDGEVELIIEDVFEGKCDCVVVLVLGVEGLGLC